MVDLKEVQLFFLEAAANTYAADAIKGTIAELPGSKVLRYEQDDLLYVDCYFSAGGKSFGQTVIWHYGKPVWGMQYSGWWKETDKRIIPFLKQALMAAYRKGEFRGGRGPEYFTDGQFRYRNRVDVVTGFPDFDGTEEIALLLKDGFEVVFRHVFSGGALI